MQFRPEVGVQRGFASNGQFAVPFVYQPSCSLEQMLDKKCIQVHCIVELFFEADARRKAHERILCISPFAKSYIFPKALPNSIAFAHSCLVRSRPICFCPLRPHTGYWADSGLGCRRKRSVAHCKWMIPRSWIFSIVR